MMWQGSPAGARKHTNSAIYFRFCNRATTIRSMSTVEGGVSRGGAHRSGISKGGAGKSGAGKGGGAGRSPPAKQPGARRFFAEPLRDYVLAERGRAVCLLQAGCLAPLRELGIGELAEAGHEVAVSVADADDPLARLVLDQIRDAYDDVIVGDMR